MLIGTQLGAGRGWENEEHWKADFHRRGSVCARQPSVVGARGGTRLATLSHNTSVSARGQRMLDRGRFFGYATSRVGAHSCSVVWMCYALAGCARTLP